MCGAGVIGVCADDDEGALLGIVEVATAAVEDDDVEPGKVKMASSLPLRFLLKVEVCW